MSPVVTLQEQFLLLPRMWRRGSDTSEGPKRTISTLTRSSSIPSSLLLLGAAAQRNRVAEPGAHRRRTSARTSAGVWIRASIDTTGGHVRRIGGRLESVLYCWERQQRARREAFLSCRRLEQNSVGEKAVKSRAMWAMWRGMLRRARLVLWRVG